MALPHRLEAGDYRDLVRRALAEDLAGGDITTDAIFGRTIARAARSWPSRRARLPASRSRSRHCRSSTRASRQRWHFRDGDECAAGAAIGRVTGSARALLSGERTALNFLQHLSGIATLAREFVRASGGAITILDTRKTTPTLRALEKYAVRMGGATNHRMSLNDGVMIKDNHIRLGGGIANAVARVRAFGAKAVIEVEVETLDQVDQALEAGADILLLDNMTTDDIRKRCGAAAAARRPKSPAVSRSRAFPSSPRPAPTSSRSAR